MNKKEAKNQQCTLLQEITKSNLDKSNFGPFPDLICLDSLEHVTSETWSVFLVRNDFCLETDLEFDETKLFSSQLQIVFIYCMSHIFN